MKLAMTCFQISDEDLYKFSFPSQFVSPFIVTSSPTSRIYWQSFWWCLSRDDLGII